MNECEFSIKSCTRGGFIVTEKSQRNYNSDTPRVIAAFTSLPDALEFVNNEMMCAMFGGTVTVTVSEDLR